MQFSAKSVFVYALFFLQCNAVAQLPAFIPERFADFLVQFVCIDDRADFTGYYQEFIATRKRIGLSERRAYMRAVHETALCDLEIKHCAWAGELQEYLGQAAQDVSLPAIVMIRYDRLGNHSPFAQVLRYLPYSEQKSIIMFLTRYGMYQEFLKDNALQHATTWHKVVSYAQNVHNRITVLIDSFI